jgi:hypothetical protein
MRLGIIAVFKVTALHAGEKTSITQTLGFIKKYNVSESATEHCVISMS